VAAQRLRFLTALFGSNPDKRNVLARLLNPGDLPGSGWKAMSQRTWPTGDKGPATEWGERARALGGLTAWRSFQNRSVRQWLWLQVAPLATVSDANAEFDLIKERGLRNQGARVKVESERDIPVEPFAGASKIWAHEQRISGLAGAGVNKLLVAVVGSNVIVVCSSGAPVVNWQAMSGLAAKQSQRVPPPLHLKQHQD
jgi:hypothetical protein